MRSPGRVLDLRVHLYGRYQMPVLRSQGDDGAVGQVNIVVRLVLTKAEYDALWEATPLTPPGTVAGVVRDRLGLGFEPYGRERPTISENEYHERKGG